MGVAEALMDNGVALAAAPAIGTSAGEARAPSVSVVVCELPRLRRVVLNGADYPVADLVAASSSVPACSHRTASTGIAMSTVACVR